MPTTQNPPINTGDPNDPNPNPQPQPQPAAVEQPITDEVTNDQPPTEELP